MRVATDRISHEALPASFQDFSPHRARGYIVNSRDTVMSAIWYAIRELDRPRGNATVALRTFIGEESW
jgi:hypothetical protein